MRAHAGIKELTGACDGYALVRWGFAGRTMPTLDAGLQPQAFLKKQRRRNFRGGR